MTNYRLLILSLITILYFTNCVDKDNSINSPIDLLTNAYINIPVIVNAENSYTFTVNANKLNYVTDEKLNFSTDTLVISLTLANTNSSDGSMKVFDNTGKLIFSELLNTNKVIVKPDLLGQIPGQIKIELVDFTGQLTAVISKKFIKSKN